MSTEHNNDDTQVSDSSTETTSTGASVQTDASSTSSSEGQTSSPETAQTLADVVQQTFDKSTSQADKEQTPPDSEKEPEAKEQTETPEQTPDKKEGEEKGPIPYERFQEVNQAKQAAEQQIEQFKPLAEAQQSVISFCEQNQISSQEFAEIMEIAAALKHDPERAMKLLEPKLTEAKSIIGEVLPPDLQKAVEAGEITAEYAKRIAIAEGKRQLTEKQSKLSQEQQAQIEGQRYFKSLRDSLGNWVESKRKTIPDFVAKTNGGPDGLFEIFGAMLQTELTKTRGQQITPDQLIQLAEKTLSSVSGMFSRPKPAPTKTVKSTQSNHGSTSEPKSLQDVVSRVARAHGIDYSPAGR